MGGRGSKASRGSAGAAGEAKPAEAAGGPPTAEEKLFNDEAKEFRVDAVDRGFKAEVASSEASRLADAAEKAPFNSKAARDNMSKAQAKIAEAEGHATAASVFAKDARRAAGNVKNPTLAKDAQYNAGFAERAARQASGTTKQARETVDRASRLVNSPS